MKNVLCVDIGTTSLKAALISGNGDILSFSGKQLSKFCDDICNHEQSENQSATSQSWLPALASATKDIFANLEKSSIIKKSATMEESASDVHKSNFQEKLSSEVCAIAISGNGPTIVSEDGTTLLWNKATDFSDEATNPLKNTKIQTNTKNPSRSLFIPRLYAFKKLYASSWNLSHYIYSGPEYLIYKLTGKSVTILPEERYETAYWKSEDLESVSLEREKLPDFVPLGFCAGNTLPEITKQLSLSKPVPVFCTGPDFIAAMIGSNSFFDGKIYDRAGSSEGVNICSSTKIIKDGVRLLPSVISEKWNASVLSE
ncbi:MAG: hypothetical protein IJR49_02570, partial [Treponema sp.]|nr:hypothetical protein [Treponema sp.]